MSDQILRPEVIEETPFPNEQVVDVTTSQSSGGVSTPTTIKLKPLPKKVIAHETISSSLNTMSKKINGVFEFLKMGAIKIGEYINGVSGEIKLSPDGIVARNNAGQTTFALDGDTGNATFKGEIQAGSLITGIVSVGDDSIVIDGETKRQVFYDDGGLPVIVIGED